MDLQCFRGAALAAASGLVCALGAAATPLPWAGAAFQATPAALLEAAASLPSLDPKISEDVLLREVALELDAGGAMKRRVREVFRLLDQGAVDDHPGVSSTWSPWFQEKPQVRARVITLDGREHWLDPATFAESGVSPDSSSLYDDDRLMRAPLPALAPGAIVEIETRLDDSAPFFAAGQVHTEAFFSDYYRRFVLTVDTPANLPLRFALDLLANARPRETSQQGSKRWQLELENFEPEYHFESGRPFDQPSFPAVSLSTGRSWSEVAQTYSELVDRAIAGVDLKAEVKTVTRGAKTELEKIERLTAWVHEKVRYTGIEFGAAKIVPYPPPVVLTRRYGDCKDKASLLVALLREAEIPAYLALLQTDQWREVAPDLPGLGGFNHAIVFVPGRTGLWIDATADSARVGQIPAEEQGRWALVAAGTTTGLVKIPELPAASNRVVISRQIELGRFGKGKASETLRYHGVPEMRSRAWIATAKEADRRQWVEQIAQNAFLSKEIAELSFPGLENLSQPLERRYQVSAVGRAVTTLDGGVVAVPYEPLWAGLDGIFTEEAPAADETDPGDEPPKPRGFDFLLAEPMDTELVVTIVPAAGLGVRELPPARRLELGAFRFEEEVRATEGGKLEARLHFTTGEKRRLSVADLDTTREAFQRFQAENPVLVLYFDHLALSQVVNGDAVDGIRRLVAEAERPQGGGVEGARLASGYLRLGLVEAARKAAELAVSREPDSAVAAEMLGLARLHGLDGELQHDGWSRDLSLAAYRDAVRLDPSLDTAWRNLGVILEHGSNELKYGRGCDLVEAAAAFQELRELSPELKDYLINEALAHLWANRWDELLPVVELLPENNFMRILRLHIALGKAGMAGFDAELKKRSQPAERGQLVVGMIGDLYLQRRYDEARALLTRPELDKLQGDARKLLDLQRLMLEKIRRVETAELLAAGPPGAIPRFFRLLDEPGASLAEGLARGTLTAGENNTAAEEGFRDGARAGMQKVVGQPIPDALSLTIDFMHSVPQPELEGNDELGYLVRLRLPPGFGGAGPPDRELVAALVVKEDGKWKIASLPAVSPQSALYLANLRVRGEMQAIDHWLRLLAKDWPKPEPYVDPWERDSFAVLGTSPPTTETERDIALASFMAQRLPGDREETKKFAPMLEQLAAALESQRATSQGQRLDAIERVLVGLLEKLERFGEASAVLTAAVARHPDSERLGEACFGMLLAVGDQKASQAWLDEQHKSRPEDHGVNRWQCQLYQESGLGEEAIACLRGLTEHPKAVAGDWNNYSWALLVFGGDLDEAIRAARRGIELRSGYPILHTLAYAYAKSGKPREAFDTLKAALASITRTQVASPDALVLGKIAENVGLEEDARRWYQRSIDEEGPGVSSPSSSAALARAAMAAMAKANGSAKQQPRSGRGS